MFEPKDDYISPTNVMRIKYIILALLLAVAIFTLGSYRYTPYCAGMFMYESDGVVTVEEVNVYHLIDEPDWEIGACKGFTFTEGRHVDTNITNEVDGSSQLHIDTSAAHLLTTGDEISISNANHASHNGVTTVTKIDADTFSCDDITYAGSAGVSSALVHEGAYVQLGTGGAGKYMIMWSISGASANAAKNWKIEPFKNSTAIDNAAGEMTPTGTAVQNCSGFGFVSLAVGDRVYLGMKNKTDGSDFNLEHANLVLFPM